MAFYRPLGLAFQLGARADRGESAPATRTARPKPLRRAPSDRARPLRSALTCLRPANASSDAAFCAAARTPLVSPPRAWRDRTAAARCAVPAAPGKILLWAAARRRRRLRQRRCELRSATAQAQTIARKLSIRDPRRSVLRLHVGT